MSKGKKIYRIITASIVSVLMIVCIVLINTLIPNYGRMMDSMLGGINRSPDNSGINTEGVNLEYNKTEYDKNSIKSAESDLSKNISKEGIVLLKNDDNSLPMKKGSPISLVGASCKALKHGTSMLGGIDVKALLKHDGFKVNEDLWKFYNKGEGKKYGLGKGSISYGDAEDFSINECPLSVLKSQKGLLASLKGTNVVFVLKRVAGEGRDMPRSMYNHAKNQKDREKTYLEPDSTELEILKYLNENCKNITLLINSNAALQLGWVSDFSNIKSVIYAPDGVEALGDILNGSVSPSGRTVDTFAADPAKSPAAMNFGDYQYKDKNGKLTKYNYVSCMEDIYVGYKYYETRYEDAVLNQGNAGDYDYSKEVVYPFGYGMSYTDFAWSDYSGEWNGDTFTAKVKVTNTGKYTGKDVVELYAQSPYTAYDIANNVEKPSVALAGYEKTKELKPGESEIVSVTCDKNQLKSFDSKKSGTYIFDAGNYYLTVAENAHKAVNNILSAKGQTGNKLLEYSGNNSDKASESMNESYVTSYAPEITETDTKTYSTDSATGNNVTAKLGDAAGDIKYLTRSNWTGTFPKHDGEPSNTISTWGNEINKDGKSYLYTKTADDKLIKQLDSFESGNPTKDSEIKDKIVYGQKNGLTLSELRGLKYSDKKWDKLLNQLTADDYYKTIGVSGYGIEPIKSVGLPFCIDADTASGLIYGGTGKMFPNAMTLAQTYNKDLAKSYGEMIGNEALIGGANGWYAPSMNIHRTPFSGRNGEYYSEDGFLSGSVASREVYGAASKGIYTYIKHFAFNDQENHRGDRNGQYGIVTWTNEQAAREIYLKPFEMCVKAGTVHEKYAVKENGKLVEKTRELPATTALMSSFNRVGATWTGGCYNLITGILRNEWGFKGMVITDNANTSQYMDCDQMIRAGADIKLTSLGKAAKFNFDKDDPSDYHYAKQALHNVLYTVVNSKSFDGVAPGGNVKMAPRISMVLRIILTLLFIFILATRFLAIYHTIRPTDKMLKKIEKKQMKKSIKKMKREEKRKLK